MEISSNIRQLIEEKASAERIEEKAIEEGMVTMIEDGLRKVKLGVTTIEEILRATKA